MGGAAPLMELRAERLREARALLDRVTNKGDKRRGEPVAGADVLPVAGPLRSLLPEGGLRRGSTVALSSPGSLLFALLAEASIRGAWCALVGSPGLGLVAASEAGLGAIQGGVVPRPGAELVAVTAALLDGVDLVAVAGVQRLPAGARQRLAARARHRGRVLLPIGHWPGADSAGGAGRGPVARPGRWRRGSAALPAGPSAGRGSWSGPSRAGRRVVVAGVDGCGAGRESGAPG